jgi:hypothetical protein
MVMLGQNGSSEWVAFAEQNAESGFEAVVSSNVKVSSNGRPRPPRTSDSATRRQPSDATSVSSWMNRPINTDNALAPVAPPPSVPKSEHPVANKRRPPRSRSSAHHEPSSTHQRSNPVSSDSSASSPDRDKRRRGPERSASTRSARSMSKTRDSSAPVPAIPVSASRDSSRRGRSRSRARSEVKEGNKGNVVQMGSANSMERSSSRSRTRTTGEHSSSAHLRTTVSNSGRSSSRPPSTSDTRRERSSSRARSSSRTPSTRQRSSSHARSNRPPSTSRTRHDLRVNVSSSNSVGPGVQAAPRGPSSARSVVSENGRKDDNIGRDISFGSTAATFKEGNVRFRPALMEKLFGDSVTDEAKQSYMLPSPTAASPRNIAWQRPDKLHSRILLTATVYHNTATNLWIATINTNQKGVAKNPAMASKYLKAFSFGSEKEARESAIANAPPKMLPFQENPSCYICTGKFAMFRRAGHCRNCGVCVCTACATMWPAKMIPETYNLKKEAHVRVCKSCTQLSSSFKKALVNGDYEEAIAIYGSGNINLRTPFPQFPKKKDETMYPIHCAVAGGNLDIVRWLVEDHFCPIKVVRAGGGGKPKRGGSADQLILTSKNRSVLTIAMAGLSVDIMRYLVVDNNVSIYDAKDLKSSLRAFEAVLLAFPSLKGRRKLESSDPRWDNGSFDDDDQSYASSFGGDQTMGEETQASSKKTAADSCIICYDHSIDCVMTPCGHQVCCLTCSKNLKVCPVCNVRGEFIKIFRP